MKLANNYYADQFRKMGFQSTSDFALDETVKVKLSNDFGKTNFINLDAIALTEIYNALQALEQRTRNK